MNLLIIYGQNALGRKLMLRLTKEGCNTVCLDDKIHDLDKRYTEKEYSLDFAETLQAAFRINNFDGVIYLGDSLIDYTYPHSKGGVLEHTLLLCKKYNVEQFMYVSQNNYEISPLFDARKDIELHICNKYANIFKINIKTVSFDTVYGEKMNCGLALRLLRAAENNAECPYTGKAEFFYLDDAVDLLWRVWNDTSGKREFTLKCSSCAVNIEYLYKKIQVLLHSNKQNIIADDELYFAASGCEDDEFISGLIWKPKYKLSKQLPNIIEWYKNRHEETAVKSPVTFRKKIQPYFENLILFGLLWYISRNFQDDSTVNSITNLDFSYVYIIIIGLLYGKKQTMWSVLLSSVYLIMRYISYGSDFVWLFYRTEPMIHIATYMFIGTAVGYVTDMKDKTLAESRQQLENAKKRFDFLYGNYLDAVHLKDTFYKQVLNNSNSLGKTAHIFKQLESVRRDQLYVAACNVVCEFLGVENAALYTVGRNGYYLRLRVRKGEICANIPQSLKIEDNPYLLELFEEKHVFINKSLQRDIPDMAAPIRFGDKIIAVIQIYNIPFEMFSLQNEIMLKVVSLLIATAVRKAAIYEELLQEKMYLPDTRIMRSDYFTERLEEAKQYEIMQALTFRRARIISQDGIVIENIIKNEAYSQLWSKLDKLVREEDVVGLTQNGGLEVLFFDLPDAFVPQVAKRLNKEGVEIEWMEK